MAIVFQNIDKDIVSAFKIKGSDDYEGLFVDWIPTCDHSRAEELLQQTEIVNKYVKDKKPIIVFDRYRSITRKEYRYLGNRTLFWEPSIIPRNGFGYQPCWLPIINIKNPPFIEVNGRTYDLGFSGSLNNKFKSFSKYYETIKGIMDLQIGINASDIKELKIDELRNNDIDVGDYGIDQFKTIVLIGKPIDYICGYLDPIFIDCIKNGVMPLLPSEHRFYYAMFDGLVLKSEINDLKFNIQMADNISFGMIHGLLENIEKFFPEMLVSSITDRVIKHFISI